MDAVADETDEQMLAELRDELYGGDEAGKSGEEEDGEAAPAGDAPAAGSVPMSKNQMKKQKRLEARLASKQAHKEKVKAEKAAKRAIVEAERAKKPPPSAESERLKAEAKASRQQNKADFRQRILSGPIIVIDCDFGPQMVDKDLRHLCQQLGYSYSACTRAAATPCHLHLLGLTGRVKEMAERQLSGLGQWAATVSERSHVDFFEEPRQRERLVYLTADSDYEMTEVDPNKIYIVGGLVDHNSHKNICATRAAQQGVATARLPIQKYVQLETSAVLTVNQVVAILTGYVANPDWATVLDAVLPRRKRSDWVAQQAKTQAEKAQADKAAAAQPATKTSAAPAGSTAAPASATAVQPSASAAAPTDATAAPAEVAAAAASPADGTASSEPNSVEAVADADVGGVCPPAAEEAAVADEVDSSMVTQGGRDGAGGSASGGEVVVGAKRKAEAPAGGIE